MVCFAQMTEMSNCLRLPSLPKPDADGHVPALEYARASLARKLIVQRKALGWSQAELARRANVRAETISRLEKAKHTADPATARKIERALEMRRTRTQRDPKAC
jgi:ribosome-binding protein aMBF1 (putative translation factor)